MRKNLNRNKSAKRKEQMREGGVGGVVDESHIVSVSPGPVYCFNSAEGYLILPYLGSISLIVRSPNHGIAQSG